MELESKHLWINLNYNMGEYRGNIYTKSRLQLKK